MEKETVAPIVDTWHERAPVDGVLNETWHDRRNQEIASSTWAEHFKCKVHTYPQLWPVDCYAFKERKILCMLELKGASRVRGVGYLNFRKYFNMIMATRISDNYLQGIFCYLPMVILTNKPTIYKRLNIKKWGRFHDDLGTK